MKGRRPLNVLAIVIMLALNLPPVVSTARPPAYPTETAREKRPAAEQVSAPLAQGTGPLQPIVRYAIKNDESPPLHSLPPIQPESEMPDREIPRLPLPRGVGLKRREARSQYADPALQTRAGPTHMPSPIRSFAGLDNNDNMRVLGFRVVPPDTQGDVGPDHYVQWVNLVFAIWDKSGHLLYGPAAGNSLWRGFGGACEATNDGDPITLYDPLADRWLMGQMALPYWPSGPFYQCIAVSTSGDPTGSWYRYQFEWENSSGQDVMNDYPKLAVWPDGYYMTANQFSAGSLSWAGTGVAAFERDQMLNGQTARMVYFDLGPSDQGGMLPADLDGSTPPPAGAPHYLLQAHADEWGTGLNDELRIYEFHVNWVAPANSTFTQVATLPTLPFDGDMCGFSRDCVPQPGTPQRLDAIADRLMHRLPYRNFGAHQTLVANLTVDADGTDHAGVRWFELRKTGSGWSIYQQGTYAPDSDHRWMGSLAMDKVGNIALGYSVSSHSTYPSIRYAGRLAGDPLGFLAQAETELAAGSSFQAGSDRWGDYSMMTVDPVDDCTFWYTQEYVPTSGSWGNWDSRIGSFQFPGCLGPTGGLEGLVEETGTGSPIAGAQVMARANPAYVTYSQPPDGRYSFAAIPMGTYTVTAQAYGYLPQTVAGVDILSGTTGSQDFSLSPAANYLVSGIVTDTSTGWPLYASIDIDGYPGAPIWTDPQTGFYSVILAEGITYTFQVRDFWEGYHVASRDVGPLTGERTENWVLDADLHACTAPGYGLDVPTIYETFDAKTRPPGWRVIDNAGTSAVWRFDNPGRAPNNTGGRDNFAIVDSDFEGSVNIDTELRTPAMDLSSLISVTLSFKYDFYWYTAGGDEVADADVSVDGGSTWTNVWTRSGGSDRGPRTAVIDISTVAAGQANVIVRFHYYNANYDWWWQVDDVFIGSQPCSFKSGGLVVGHVYDGNTGGPVVGATVTNDSGESSTAAPTPLDPNVDDAFYTIFSPAGPHTLAATMSGGYGSDVRTLTAIEGDVVWQDFHLPAGTLSHAPDSLQVTLDWQASTTVPLTLINDGAEAAAFEIREREGDSGVTPLSAADRLHKGGQVRTVAESNEATPGDLTSIPAPGAEGGPDGFGYVFKDSNELDGPTYEWVEIAPPAGGSGTAVGLSGTDDGYFWPLDLPFAFNFYGTDYSQLAVASNGTVYFEDDYLGLSNTGIPGTNSYGVYTFIAHFWDDLVVDPGEVYYLLDDDRLIIEYYQLRAFGSYGDHGTWQVTLFQSGNILFQYQDTTIGDYGDYGALATVGIQGDVVTGLQYSYDTPALSDELAICFAYPGNPPDCRPGDVPWLSEEPA
ncbi:MAG: carboxypeptidase regulatory-like domain-containing protein, partial [Anaerolineae bacterium]